MHDGAAGHDGGGPVFEDAGDAGSTPDRCPELLSTYPSVGLPELPGLERATGTVAGVDASGADLDIGGRAARWAWPADWAGSGIDRLAPGMEVELSQAPGQSRLVAPGVTLHAFVGYGSYPMSPFVGPILVDGVPPIDFAAGCDGMVDGPCGPVLASEYELAVGDGEPLATGESTSGDGYAVHFGGAARYLGRSDETCIDEAWFAASIAVRVDAAPVTCESLEDDYARTIEQGSTCSDSSDCHVISGHCGRGLGGCWYAVSADIEDELAALAERYSDLGCTTAVCRCAPAPDTIVCDSGRCAFPP